VELIIDVSEDLPAAWADHVRLRQILNNLVSNAAKFTHEGSITVHAHVVEHQNGNGPVNMLQISVTDTGEGIAPNNLDLVFQQFRQADGSSTRKAGGTGLGLAITRHLVEMHGGHIWVESTLGQGSTFAFTMPIAAMAVAQ
jgi:signal transduction histidine kinase